MQDFVEIREVDGVCSPLDLSVIHGHCIQSMHCSDLMRMLYH